ncbi:MAG: substrate-binding domain-containing protein [Planctomycetaceae bacterium]
MSRLIAAVLGSAVLLAVLSVSLLREPPLAESTDVSDEPLIVYCAASNKAVLEAIREDYERECGTRLQIQYGPSQTLLASLKISGTGDLYLPADDSYLDIARKENLLNGEFSLAKMQAVLVTAKGNPKGIASLKDLMRSEIRLAQGNPEATAIGKLTHAALSASGQWDALKLHTSVFKTTVNDVANDVMIGAVDAGIVFDAILHDYPSLETVPLPELATVQAHVAISTLKCSEQPTKAAHFARYMTSHDKGLKRYREFGFQPVDGDPWSDRPEITIYAGSMLRPAIESTLTDFEQREGVRIRRVYNGCGILVAQMKAGQVPDAYFACDVEFMNQVKNEFPEVRNVSQNELVILVPKGNPRNIRSLKDLTTPGLRVGIGHEKQCAMGWLTQRTLDESGMQDEVMKNVAVQTPTGDMLVNQMRSGSLDAAVAYLSNAAGSADFLDAIRIQGIPCSVATQPFGVSKESPNKHLIERLRNQILDDPSKTRFTQEGFRWIAQE